MRPRGHFDICAIAQISKYVSVLRCLFLLLFERGFERGYGEGCGFSGGDCG